MAVMFKLFIMFVVELWRIVPNPDMRLSGDFLSVFLFGPFAMLVLRSDLCLEKKVQYCSV